LFYGKVGLGKSRWATRTAHENDYIHVRLDANKRPKTFPRELLMCLLHKTMPYYEVVGTQNEIFNQILDLLQRDLNIVFFLDEIDDCFSNERILATVRYLADMSLVTFVLVGMEKAKEKLMRMDAHFFNLYNGFYEIESLSIHSFPLRNA